MIYGVRVIEIDWYTNGSIYISTFFSSRRCCSARPCKDDKVKPGLKRRSMYPR